MQRLKNKKGKLKTREKQIVDWFATSVLRKNNLKTKTAILLDSFLPSIFQIFYISSTNISNKCESSYEI